MPDSELTDESRDELASAAVVGVDTDEHLSEAALAALPAEVFAESLGDYLKAWGRRLRNGESGALPVILGLIAIVIFFQLQQSVFLSSNNLVNLFVLAALYVMFGLAELFALLMSEIDLSIGYLAGAAAFIATEINNSPVYLPWWVGVVAALAFCFAWTFMQGSLITRFGLPSFVVTLGGFLALNGIMLELANVDSAALGGAINLNGASPIYKLVGARMSPALSWIVLVAGLIALTAVNLRRAQRRRAHGLTAPPIAVTLLTIAVAAVAGVVLVAICNSNTPTGVPWVVPFVLVILMACQFLLFQTRFGRYIFAVGANPEAARRSGINVKMVTTLGFVAGGIVAGFAAMVYASNLGGIATDYDGGTIVLYAVAAAVIGGASLFGGKGRPLNALLGGLVIAVVVNGLALMGVSAAVNDIVTAVVLIAAVLLDALVRRRATAGMR